VASGPSDSTVLLLSTSDTDLLAAKASGADYRLANPVRVDPADLAPLLDGSDVVVVRLLGGEQVWREGLAALRRQPLPAMRPDQLALFDVSELKKYMTDEELVGLPDAATAEEKH